MQTKPTPLATPLPKSKLVGAPTVQPADVRERKVKRFVAFCAYDESHNAGAKLHPTRDAAIVASVRHLRADHADTLYAEKTAIRRAQVTRTIVGEEVVED